MRGFAGFDRLFDPREHPRRESDASPPVVLKQMPGDAPDAHAYQLPDAPPPPKLPPPPQDPAAIAAATARPGAATAAGHPAAVIAAMPAAPHRRTCRRHILDDEGDNESSHTKQDRGRERPRDEPGEYSNDAAGRQRADEPA